MSKKNVRLVICKDDGLNEHLTNVLDADLKITQLLNIRNQQTITRNNKSNLLSVKGAIVYRKNKMRTVIMIMTKRYMLKWNECLIMKKILIEVLVTVHN